MVEDWKPSHWNVVLVEPTGSRRQLLADTFRACGFTKVQALKTVMDALHYLEVESADWIVSPLMLDAEVNFLHLVRLVTKVPELMAVRTSALVAPGEEACLTLAYEMGLLSHHAATYQAEELRRELETFLKRCQESGGHESLIAATYLRQHLRHAGLLKSRRAMERSLLELFPGSTDVLVGLAEVQFESQEFAQAETTLHQVLLLSPERQDEVEQLRARYSEASAALDLLADEKEPLAPVQGSPINALGIKNCFIIDPDSSVQYFLERLLREAGVPDVQAFSDGAEAWRVMQKGSEPGLIIQEWRIPGLSGPLLLQRVKSHGFHNVPIMVVSSLVKPEEAPLLRELGVDAMIQKPFDQQAILETVVWTLQQNSRPTEEKSLERKIGKLLDQQQLSEAKRLKQVYLKDERIDEGSRKKMEAIFAFHEGRYEEAANAAMEALRLSGDNLLLLNILGKALLKVGRFEPALKCFQKAQAFSPLNVGRLCLIAETQQEIGDETGAQAALASAGSIDSSAPVLVQTSCNIALRSGDTEKARSLLSQLDAVPGILSFMNNRAVALTRCGRFEEGISLYRNTLQALPGEQTGFHDAVIYNLGLAHARYGALPESLRWLNEVRGTTHPAVLKKAQSLAARVSSAISRGGSLQLSDTESVPTAPKKSETAALPGGSSTVPVPLELRRGDKACLLVFRCLEGLDRSVMKYLEHPPPFKPRTAIQRDESFGHAATKRNGEG